jgi:hypothetical protein
VDGEKASSTPYSSSTQKNSNTNPSTGEASSPACSSPPADEEPLMERVRRFLAAKNAASKPNQSNGSDSSSKIKDSTYDAILNFRINQTNCPNLQGGNSGSVKTGSFSDDSFGTGTYAVRSLFVKKKKPYSQL